MILGAVAGVALDFLMVSDQVTDGNGDAGFAGAIVILPLIALGSGIGLLAGLAIAMVIHLAELLSIRRVGSTRRYGTAGAVAGALIAALSLIGLARTLGPVPGYAIACITLTMLGIGVSTLIVGTLESRAPRVS